MRSLVHYFYVPAPFARGFIRRKHQIRRHLAEIGHPVVGDRLYGSPGDREDLQLVSEFLAFDCPVGGDRKEFRVACQHGI